MNGVEVTAFAPPECASFDGAGGLRVLAPASVHVVTFGISKLDCQSGSAGAAVTGRIALRTANLHSEQPQVSGLAWKGASCRS
jgi:hypothetical protein